MERFSVLPCWLSRMSADCDRFAPTSVALAVPDIDLPFLVHQGWGLGSDCSELASSRTIRKTSAKLSRQDSALWLRLTRMQSSYAHERLRQSLATFVVHYKFVDVLLKSRRSVATVRAKAVLAVQNLQEWEAPGLWS